MTTWIIICLCIALVGEGLIQAFHWIFKFGYNEGFADGKMKGEAEALYNEFEQIEH